MCPADWWHAFYLKRAGMTICAMGMRFFIRWVESGSWTIWTNFLPKEVWRYFSEVCSVPRGSGFTDGIRDYLVRFAAENNLYCKVDDIGNVIIRKPATDGCTLSSLLFQGHMDMVCEKNSDIKHDFHKDPLEVIVDEKNGTVKANGTTLGGDDGIAIAIAIPRPPRRFIHKALKQLWIASFVFV